MFQIKYQDIFFKLTPGQNPEMQRNSPLFALDNLLLEVSTPFNIAYDEGSVEKLNHFFFELSKKKKTEYAVELYLKQSYRCNATLVITGSNMDWNHPQNSMLSGY